MNTPNRRQALGAGLTVTALAGLSACGGGAVGAIDAGDPVKGGTLRVGVTGGNSADTVDAHIPVNNGDVCRAVNLYNALYGWDDDSQVGRRWPRPWRPTMAPPVGPARCRKATS